MLNVDFSLREIYFVHETFRVLNFIRRTCCVLIFIRRTCCVLILVPESLGLSLHETCKLINLLVKLIKFMKIIASWFLFVELVLT